MSACYRRMSTNPTRRRRPPQDAPTGPGSSIPETRSRWLKGYRQDQKSDMDSQLPGDLTDARLGVHGGARTGQLGVSGHHRKHGNGNGHSTTGQGAAPTALAASAGRTPTGDAAVQPDRDRARPVGPRAVSWFQLHGQITTTLPPAAHAGAAGALSTPGMGDRLGVEVPWRKRWC
jgi:hypothetical protein